MRDLSLSILTLIVATTQAFAITPIPVHFVPFSKLPIIDVAIEGQSYSFELDTGAAGDIIIKSDILDRIHNKKNTGIIKTVDINGNIYENNRFLISSVKMGSLTFESVSARQENPELLQKGCVVWSRSGRPDSKAPSAYPEIAGRIGWGILKNHCWYFDLSHSLLWAVDNLAELEAEVPYFSVAECAEVPFECEDMGIVLSVDTNIGMAKMMLDTGANISCLRKSLIQSRDKSDGEKNLLLSKMRIGGALFEPCLFFLYHFTSLFKVDGILGIQFFERNGLYLDFQNKKALIGFAKRPFWDRWMDRTETFLILYSTNHQSIPPLCW